MEIRSACYLYCIFVSFGCITITCRAWTLHKPDAVVAPSNGSPLSMTRRHATSGQDTTNNNLGRRNFLESTKNLILAGSLLAVGGAPMTARADGDESETVSVATPSTSASSSKTLEQMKEEESTILAELEQDKRDEQMAEQDTRELMSRLEESTSSPTSDDSSSSTNNNSERSNEQQLIDKLEQEEEKIEKETLELIEQVETLESQAEAIQQPLLPEDKEEAQEKSKGETEEFLTKLKERVTEKEDLIAKLKALSEQDVDPKTGKFRAMKKTEFTSRAPTDFDFFKYLQEDLAKDEVFQNDLDFFRQKLKKGMDLLGSGKELLGSKLGSGKELIESNLGIQLELPSL